MGGLKSFSNPHVSLSPATQMQLQVPLFAVQVQSPPQHEQEQPSDSQLAESANSGVTSELCTRSPKKRNRVNETNQPNRSFFNKFFI